MTERPVPPVAGAAADPAAAPAAPKPKPRPAAQRGPRPPAAVTVPALAFAAFFGIFTVLSLRMGAGEDPALGTGAPVQAAAPAPDKRILVRRIVKKTVILPPIERAAPATVVAARASAPAPSGGGAAPATAGPAPAGAAPAPAAPTRAPAPAPAAPPVTRSS
jgi:hypothetical protein